MDYYTNADVVKTGDIEAIGTGLVEHENVRDNDFDCIMIAGTEGNTYNDIGTKTQISERPYFKAIMKDGNAGINKIGSQIDLFKV